MVKTRAEQILEHRESLPPQASPLMAKSVSHVRRQSLEDELEQGLYRESGNYTPQIQAGAPRSKRSSAIGNELTSSGVVRGSGDGIFRAAQATPTSPVSGAGGAGGSGGNGFRGSGSTARQVPEVYSPLWLNSNLNLPRDRATINAWSRSFFALNPIVHNAITLHSTYPIAKLNIKCKNQKIEKFFAEMVEELDLMTLCCQIAQEYWVLGEAFIYAELDERTAKWSRLLIQNPDYITVKRSVIAGEPIISMRPDENLRRMIFSQKPSDVQQRQQLDPAIVEHVKRGESIPLNNFYVSHLARKISPYEVRGTGVIVSNFRNLMLLDKFKECHDEETEVLTDQGFKKYQDVIEYSEVMDGTYNQPYVVGAVAKPGIKIACFNPTTQQIEYHAPLDAIVKNYSGEMYRLKSKSIDIMVTPGHELYVQKNVQKNKIECKTEWLKIKAEKLANQSPYQYHIRSVAEWTGNKVSTFDVLDKKIPAELYLKFLGYLISEGCITRADDPTHLNTGYIGFTQSLNSDCFKDLTQTVRDFFAIFNKKVCEIIRQPDGAIYKKKPSKAWQGTVGNGQLYKFFKDKVGTNGKCVAQFKRIPKEILNLSPDLLKIFLNALVAGDGSERQRKNCTTFKYFTSSKQLADDVQEVVFKCGFYSSSREYVQNGSTYYEVGWSTSKFGRFPSLSTTINGKAKQQSCITKENYTGKVWCFTVPTGIMITRRNGKMAVQAQCKFAQADNMVNPMTLIKIGSDEFRPTPTDLEAWRNVFTEAQYDKDFKIFTHNAVTVERVGYGQGIYDTSGDVTQLTKELFIGLMVPSVIMDGSDTTYATGSVALDVLRQRYMQFRNMLGAWLKRKIFAPISKLNDFYEYIDGEKKLIVPEIDWNHMSLFDMSDYIQNLSTLATGEGAAKKISLQTLYRSLGVDYEDEQRKIRYEDIQDAIRTREIQSLANYPLNQLRALTPRDEIDEFTEEPLPGEVNTKPEAGEASGGGGDGGGGGGGAPMELGGLDLPGAPAGPPSGTPPPAPVGRPKGPQPAAPGGGTGIGAGGIPKPV